MIVSEKRSEQNDYDKCDNLHARDAGSADTSEVVVVVDGHPWHDEVGLDSDTADKNSTNVLCPKTLSVPCVQHCLEGAYKCTLHRAKCVPFPSKYRSHTLSDLDPSPANTSLVQRWFNVWAAFLSKHWDSVETKIFVSWVLSKDP